jgi:hypothetical protein
MKLHGFYISGVTAAIALYAHSASASSEEWLQMGGCAQSIAASEAGVWIVGCNEGIGNNSAIYWNNPSTGWQQVTSSIAVATQVGVSASGNVWAINKAGQIGQLPSPKANGTSAPPNWLATGTATQGGVAVDTANDVYIRGLGDVPCKWNGSGWSCGSSPGGLANWIAFFNTAPSFGAMVYTTQSGEFWEDGIYGWSQIAGANGTFVADHVTLAVGSLFFYNDATNVWTPDSIALPVAASSVAGIAANYNPSTKTIEAYLIDTSGHPWLETGGSEE